MTCACTQYKLCHAGLTSSDEDEDPVSTADYSNQQTGVSDVMPSTGRLKKRAHEQIEQPDGAGLDDIADDLPDNIVVDTESNGNEERAKRARAIFDDSDDE